VHGAGDFLGRASEVGRRFGVPHEILTADEIRVRYPQFQLEGPERALFEPGAGMVFPEACIRAQLAEARRLGASVIVDTPVNSITTLGGGVRIQTATGDYAAEAAVATVGAWAPGLLGGAMSRLVLQPQALHWFSCEDPAAFSPERFPAFMWMHGDGPEDGFYGFPIAPGGTRGVKLATEFHGEIASPEALDRQAPPGEAMFRRHVAGRLAGVEPRVLASVACLYATTPDSDFAIGWVGDRLLAASACSGHGFKHSAALGEMLASAVIAGSASAPPPQFDLARLSSETSTATLASAK
jgi:sarcosine oxidase